MAMAVGRDGRITENVADELREAFSAFLAGNNAAFNELYCELNPRLSAYCYKISPAIAEDLMQELWERVIALRSHQRQEKQVANPAAFLFRMLRNLTIDHHRQSKEHLALDEAAFDLADRSHQSDTARDLEAIILEALEKLPASDKEILVLNIYSGYKFGEIAEMLGKSTDAVWQQASRARAKLRTIVMEEAKRFGITLPQSKSKKNGAIV